MKLHRTPTKIVSLLPHWPSHCLSSTKVFYLVPSVQQTELHLKKKLTVRHTRAECVCVSVYILQPCSARPGLISPIHSPSLHPHTHLVFDYDITEGQHACIPLCMYFCHINVSSSN
jgi:hypothetical protein